MAQLTTDRRRTGAHRFYARLGFVASHEGFKLALCEAPAPENRHGPATGRAPERPAVTPSSRD